VRKASRPPFLHAAKAILIHPSAWKAVFYELRPNGVLRSSRSPGRYRMGSPDSSSYRRIMPLARLMDPSQAKLPDRGKACPQESASSLAGFGLLHTYCSGLQTPALLNSEYYVTIET
jgi:hypothetical protein